MTDSSPEHDEHILMETPDACVDVPEGAVSDPFDDAITEEIVVLDQLRLDLSDVELL